MAYLEYNTNFNQYYSQIKKYPVLSNREERQLCYLIKNGSKEEQTIARKRLIECNLRLVVKIAKEFINFENASNIFLDIIQIGNIGLMEAIKKYDLAYNNRFSTYAVWWIRKEIQSSLDEFDIIKKTNYASIKIREFRKIKKELELSLKRIPTDQEIVDEYNRINNLTKKININDYYELLSTQNVLSLETILEDNSKITINNEALLDKNIDVENEVINNMYNEYLKIRINTIIEEKLTDREKDIITKRFGLNNNEPETLKEIAEDYHCTGECIRQTEIKVLEKLNKTLKLKKYKI